MQWLQRNRQLVQHHRLLLDLHQVQDLLHQEHRQVPQVRKDLLKEAHLLDIMVLHHQVIMDHPDLLAHMVVPPVGLQ